MHLGKPYWDETGNLTTELTNAVRTVAYYKFNPSLRHIKHLFVLFGS
jgi:hypothetical protein